MSDVADEHGLYYVTRDGRTRIGLDRLLIEFPEPGAIPRPERDVLAALLQFCIEGLDRMNVRERTEIGGIHRG
jgi:hypothetical protein